MNPLKSIVGLAAISATAFFGACENDNINPLDCVVNNTDTIYVGDNDNYKVVTRYAKYPIGSIVWKNDTTLAESFKVPENQSLYIEPGVTVTCSSAADPKVEIVVLGNLYCLGTEEKPVVFTTDSKEDESWGGIICGYNSQEVVLDHVVMEWAGATPTESSISFQNQLFKTTIDGGVPAFHFCNVKGRFVVSNCTFRNIFNDATYFTGGDCIMANNQFFEIGNSQDGGEAINFKSGCKADIAQNLIYNVCSNGFKLSNAGVSETVPSSRLCIYNNSIVNTGWRRAKNKKGGSVWVEKGIAPVFVNNLIYDCRFGIKQPDTDGADLAHSLLSPNYYFASTDAGVKQYLNTESGVISFEEDTRSTTAGEGDPLFAKFTRTAGMDINCQTDDQSQGAPATFDASWDFHLAAASPALKGDIPGIAPLWNGGLPFSGLKSITFINSSDERSFFYYSPVPTSFFGAFGK